MRTVRFPTTVWLVASAILLALGLTGMRAPALLAQAGTQGQWRTLTTEARSIPFTSR